MFGRLAPGATMQSAQAELDADGRRAAAAFPETHATLRPMVMPYTHSLTDIQGTTTWMAVQMQLMVSLPLVVVAPNVAVLVHARTAMRQGEIAPRSALVTSRRRRRRRRDALAGGAHGPRRYSRGQSMPASSSSHTGGGAKSRCAARARGPSRRRVRLD